MTVILFDVWSGSQRDKGVDHIEDLYARWG